MPEVKKYYINNDNTIVYVNSINGKVINCNLCDKDLNVIGNTDYKEYTWKFEGFKEYEHTKDPQKETPTNSFTFDIDNDGNLSISQNGKPIKRFNVRGPEGKPGKDGMPGQDGAPGHPGKDGATGQPGRDGTPGKNGADGIPGPEGKQGATGPKGEDGVHWYPEISKDGTKLRFVNRNNTTDVTEWYDIKGAKGDTGAEGPRGEKGPEGPVFIPSVNANGDLSWSNNGIGLNNPPSRNIKGDKGDKGDKGATFHPIVKDGVLYWYNDDGNFVERITPVRITGAQGNQGERGAQGLSAYEIWLKQGFLGTEQDFLDSLKGEKGEPAKPATFSYQDVDDYKCKVQKIDTKLIMDSADPDQSPKEIIEERTEEIKKLRELGREKRNQSWFRKWSIWNIVLLCLSIIVLIGTIIGSNVDVKQHIQWKGLIILFSVATVVLIGVNVYQKYKDKKRKTETISKQDKDQDKKNAKKEKTDETPKAHRIGLLKDFFWWCAGADKDLLAMCPGDHAKYVGIGTTILFTALMAWFSSFIAMQLVFPEAVITIGSHKFNYAAALFATFWMALIFSLDRFITNTMYSDGKVTISKQEFIGGLPRIVIAIILGIIISAPLELRIFNDRINLEIENIKAKERNADKDRELEKSASRLERITSPYQSQKDNYNAQLSNYTSELNLIPKCPEPDIHSWTDSSGYHQVTRNQKEIKDWGKKYGEQYQKALANINKVNKDIEKVDSLIKLKGNENASEDSLTLADVDIKYDNKFDDGLLRRLAILHELGMEGYDGKEWFKSGGTFGVVLDVLFHRWWWFLFNSAIGLIMLLFILIDISPVLYKMMLADGKYDNYLHQEKLLAQDKIRLSLANMLKGLDDSELKRVAPFVMGDIYSKMAGDSYIYKTEEEFKDEIANQKGKKILWRIWPFTWIRAIFWREEEKPSAPVIIFEKKKPSQIENDIEGVNKEVFDEVLDMKKRIILASYRRWYKTQHDCIICDDINDENKGKEPFEEDSYPPRDPDNKQKGKDPDDKKKEDVKDGTKHDDKSNDDSHKGNDPFGDDDNSFDEKVNDDLGAEDSQETNSNEESTNETETTDSKESEDVDEDDDDEHELPDDDGDDRPQN